MTSRPRMTKTAAAEGLRDGARAAEEHGHVGSHLSGAQAARELRNIADYMLGLERGHVPNGDDRLNPGAQGRAPLERIRVAR